MIHTGSRLESGLVDQYAERPGEFDLEFARVSRWTEENRVAVGALAERYISSCRVLLDHGHNSFEICVDESVIIRKGAVRVDPGDLTVLPSSMTGDVALLRAGQASRNAAGSLSHGTGRTMSRSDARGLSNTYDFGALRWAVYIPSYIGDDSLRTEAPYCYRDLDATLALLGDLAEEVERYATIAYLGHL